MPRLGKYVFVVHFYQPAYPTFPVHVHVNAGHVWSGRHPNWIELLSLLSVLAHWSLFGITLLGSFSASFCPHSSGCRDQVIAENQIELDISEPEVSVTVMIPDRRMLVLVSLLRKCTWKYSSNFTSHLEIGTKVKAKKKGCDF